MKTTEAEEASVLMRLVTGTCQYLIIAEQLPRLSVTPEENHSSVNLSFVIFQLNSSEAPVKLQLWIYFR